MITLSAVVEPVLLRCPYCEAPMAVLGPHTLQMIGKGWLLLDGDTLNFERSTDGQNLALSCGCRPCCGKSWVMIEAVTVDAEPPWESDFAEAFFRKNKDCGEPTHYMASRGKRSWWVTRFESDLGPVLEHQIGPLAVEPEWQDIKEITACGDGPWDLAKRILASLWDDLLALQKDVSRAAAS